MPGHERPVQSAGAESAPGRRRLAAGPRGVRSAMEITRKTFFSGAAIGLATLTFLPGGALGAPPQDVEGDARLLRDAVGETFYARGAGGVLVPLGLQRSVDVRSDAKSEQYSLYFTDDGRHSLTEGAWRLESANGRRVHDVFLVPAGTNASGDRLYRADFCLLRGVVPPPPRR